MNRSIVILGGGVGGLVAAQKLRALLGEEHRIVLIEKELRHAFAPSFLWLMVGQRKEDQIACDLSRLVPRGVELIHGEIRKIDLANRRVITDTVNADYDYLIIALGAQLAPENISGLEEAQTFYTLPGAKRLQGALGALKSGTVAIVVSALPYKCPGAPHEAAMLLDDFLKTRGLRDKVKIDLFTPEPQPMPIAGPALGQAVQQLLESKGIGFHPRHKLTSVNPQSKELSFEGNPSFKYDLLIAIPPHRPPAAVQGIGITNEAGWIPVNRATLETKLENVYAIGDVTALPIPGRWDKEIPLNLPKAGVFAHAQAEVAAQRIASQIQGTAARAEFGGQGYCMLEAGQSVAGFAYGNFFAEPSPQVNLHPIGKSWHLGKALFEKWWLAPLGIRKSVLGSMIRLGAKSKGTPVTL